MKTRLLRRLRRKAEKVYKVAKFNDGYYVVKVEDQSYSLYHQNLVLVKQSRQGVSYLDAVKSCEGYRRGLILGWVRTYRSKKKYGKIVY